MSFPALSGLVRAVFQLECLVSMTPACPLLLRDCCFSMILSVQVHEDLPSAEPLPMKTVGSELNASIFFSESRRKHVMVWMVQRRAVLVLVWLFSCSCQITSLLKLPQHFCNSPSRLLLLARQMKQSQAIKVHLS